MSVNRREIRFEFEENYYGVPLDIRAYREEYELQGNLEERFGINDVYLGNDCEKRIWAHDMPAIVEYEPMLGHDKTQIHLFGRGVTVPRYGTLQEYLEKRAREIWIEREKKAAEDREEDEEAI